MLMGMTQERKINESMKRDIGEEQQAVARQNHSASEDSVVQKNRRLINVSTTCLKFLLLCSTVISHFTGIEHIPERHRDCVLMKLVRIFRGMTFLPTSQTLGQYVRIYI